MTSPRSRHRTGQAKFVFLFIFFIVGSARESQGSVPSIAQLREQIMEIEAQWTSCSVEIIYTSFSTDSLPVARTVEHYLLLDGLFREHALTPSDVPSFEPHMTIRQWDRDTYVVIKPNDQVNCRDSLTSDLPPAQPYGVVLSTLEFTGGLSDFLNDEEKGVIEVLVSVAETEHGFLAIKRMSRLPGSGKWQVIEVELDVQRGLRVVSGRRYTDAESDGTVAVNKTVLAAFPHTTDHSLRYDLKVTGPSVAAEGNARDALTLRVSVEQLADPPISDTVWVRELTGNPRIRKYADDKVISEYDFYPEEKDRGRPWSALERWLMINDVLLLGVATVWGLRRVSRVVRPSAK